MIKSADIPVEEWQWFGNPGHFICGQWCRFHLCTRVGSYLVSTVGEYVHPRHSAGSEQTEEEWLNKNWPGEMIGCDRYDETMVFKAGPPCLTGGCMCETPELDGGELDMNGYMTRGDAARGHFELCLKWSKQ